MMRGFVRATNPATRAPIVGTGTATDITATLGPRARYCQERPDSEPAGATPYARSVPEEPATTGSRSRITVTPETYARITVWALVLIGLIVVTGGAVRLTQSGLGCTDWPTCEDNRIYPAWHLHGWIEFGNRLVTGAVSIAVVAAVLASRFRMPRRRDLTWLSWGLVAGVIAQIVLGGLVVLSHLWPPLVMGHFILSQILVTNAVVLWHRARLDDHRTTHPWPDRRVHRGAWALAACTAVAVMTGTVVTGTGPHSGSHDGQLVERLPFALTTVTRIHGIADFAVIVSILVLTWRLRTSGAPRTLLGRVETVLVFGLLQAAVGYTQYLTGVPPLLVTLHILGATLICGSVTWLVLGVLEWSSTDAPGGGDHDPDRRDDGSHRDQARHDLVDR